MLREAVGIEPSNLMAYRMLGSLYLSQRKLDEARREFENIAVQQQRTPQGIAASTITGMILEAQNQPADAKTRYQEVLQKDPNAAVAANNLAYLMAQSDDGLDVALRLAQTAKAKLPTSPEVSDALGWIYYKK